MTYDAETQALLIRARDLLIPALVSGMAGSGLDYEKAGNLLADLLAALPEDTEGGT